MHKWGFIKGVDLPRHFMNVTAPDNTRQQRGQPKITISARRDMTDLKGLKPK